MINPFPRQVHFRFKEGKRKKGVILEIALQDRFTQCIMDSEIYMIRWRDIKRYGWQKCVEKKVKAYMRLLTEHGVIGVGWEKPVPILSKSPKKYSNYMK